MTEPTKEAVDAAKTLAEDAKTINPQWHGEAHHALIALVDALTASEAREAAIKLEMEERATNDHDRIQELHNTLHWREKKIADLNDDLAAKDARIAELEGAKELAPYALGRAMEELNQALARIATLEAENAKMRQQLGAAPTAALVTP